MIALPGLRNRKVVAQRSAAELDAMATAGSLVAAALDAAAPPNDPRPRLIMSPRGKPFTQARVRALASGPGVVILCARFEGVDERIVAARGLEEVSIGDYVLTNGALPAMVVIDAVARLLPGVLGDDESSKEESFSEGAAGLEYPQYTRPAEFRGMKVPEVLLSGHHSEIAKWRAEQAKQRTKERRPDLL